MLWLEHSDDKHPGPPFTLHAQTLIAHLVAGDQRLEYRGFRSEYQILSHLQAPVPVLIQEPYSSGIRRAFRESVPVAVTG